MGRLICSMKLIVEHLTVSCTSISDSRAVAVCMKSKCRTSNGHVDVSAGSWCDPGVIQRGELGCYVLRGNLVTLHKVVIR